MIEKLKPCPFCGNTEIRTDSLRSQKVSQVFCNDCGLMVQQRVDEDALIKFWNTRTIPEPEASADAVERVAKAIYLNMFPENTVTDWDEEKTFDSGRLYQAYCSCAQAAINAMITPIYPKTYERERVAKSIYEAGDAGEHKWEQIKDMAAKDGYIVAKECVSVSYLQADAAIAAMGECFTNQKPDVGVPSPPATAQSDVNPSLVDGYYLPKGHPEHPFTAAQSDDVESMRLIICEALGVNPKTHSYKYVAEAACRHKDAQHQQDIAQRDADIRMLREELKQIMQSEARGIDMINWINEALSVTAHYERNEG